MNANCRLTQSFSNVTNDISGQAKMPHYPQYTGKEYGYENKRADMAQRNRNAVMYGNADRLREPEYSARNIPSYQQQKCNTE